MTNGPGREPAGGPDPGSDRREAERARALLAHLPGAAAFVVDEALRYQVAEGEALALAGLAPGDLVGRTIAEALGPAVEAEYAPIFRRALAGEPFEREHAAHGRVYLTRGGPLRDAAGRVTAAFAVSTDITARRRAEAALEASEARQAFLLALSDGLRPMQDPLAVQGEACRRLGERLGVDRAYYVEVDEAAGVARVGRDWVRAGGGRSLVGEHRVADFAWSIAILRGGACFVVDDTQTSPLVPSAERPASAAVQLVACAGAPLVKGGRLVGALCVSAARPRAWTAEEVALVEEVAGRTWEAVQRARAEAARRASEARYRTLFETMREGFAVCELVRDADGAPADLRYVELNPALEQLTGRRVADVLGRRFGEVLGPEEARFWTDAYGAVLASGAPERFEHFVAPLGRWFAVDVAPHGPDRVAVLYADVTDRKAAEAALRARAERQAFLLRLADALRAEPDADAIATRALAMLAERLPADRCYVGVYRVAEDRGELGPQVGNDRVPPVPPVVRLSDFPEALRVASQQTLVVHDVSAVPGFTDGDRRNLGALGMRGLVAATLRRGQDHPLWSIVVVSADPRRWAPDDVALVEDVAERTWAAVERARTEAALRARGAQYRAIVEGARDYAIITTDADGRIESWSPGAEAVFGWGAAEVAGRPIDLVFTPDDREARVPEAERAAALAGGVAPDVRWHACKDGGRVFIEGTLRALRDPAGRPLGFLKVGQDVTRRRALDEALRASQTRFRALVDNVVDYAIFGLDAEGRVTEWTAGAERVKGYRAEEVVGGHLAQFYTPEDAAAGVPQAHLAEAAAAGRGEWEGWRVRKDGTRFWVNEIATSVRDADGRLVGFTKISRDLTERRLAEQAAEQAQLAAARDELRRALAAAEETERQRLARELHDQLGQELTAFRLGLDDAARLAAAHLPPDAAGREPLLDRLTRLGALAGRMTAGARYLALELRPPELDDLGFESAVQTYVAEWSARYGVAADVAVTGVLRERALGAEVGSTLYRIVQEALTNVAKHAGARQVSVVVEKPDGEVRLIVEDDGRGFDVEATVARANAARRLGLAGMRERAALAGGTVAVESSPGAGTTLYVRLPLAGPA